MIYGLLISIGSCRSMDENLDKAIDRLMASDINALPLGKTVVDGGRIFPQVTEAGTRQLADESCEVYRSYTGIQINIEGCEVIETALNGMTPIKEYQPDFQKAAARGGARGYCVMGPDRLVLCVAEEAHGPGGCLQEPECAKKYVVEVAMADERPW